MGKQLETNSLKSWRVAIRKNGFLEIHCFSDFNKYQKFKTKNAKFIEHDRISRKENKE